MMAVVIYTTATGKDEVPGYKGSISAPFLKAIAKGTDPKDPDYWGDPIPKEQVGSVFALGVLLNPKLFWDPLSPEQKNNLLRFLQKQAFNQTYDGNHYYFHMVAVPLLEQHGLDSNREHLTRMYERLFGWYRGNGWFLDGNNRDFDYYNLWGFQLFNQVLFKYDRPWRDHFGERIKESTGRFLETYPYLFGRDGGPIPWGRSLTYRFAGNAAVAWAVLNGNSPLPPGEARRIVSGSLKYFWQHGALGEDNLLDIGFRGANASMAELYIFPGDPYWAVQGLACLLIPASDPFWTDEEMPMPADGAGGKLAVPGAQMTLRVSPIDGEARLFPAGQPMAHPRSYWQSGSKYDQHAYSSYLGWCTDGEGGRDIGAGRSGYSYDGANWFYRERARPLTMDTDHLVSAYPLKPHNDKDPAPGLSPDEMFTHTLVGNDGEVHVFWHNHPDPLYLHLGGYGISVPQGGRLSEEREKDRLLINGGENFSVVQIVQAPEGEMKAELLTPREGWTNSHLFGGEGAFPYWRSLKPVPPRVPVIIYTNGTRGRKPAAVPIQLRQSPGLLRIQLEGKWYEIEIPY